MANFNGHKRLGYTAFIVYSILTIGASLYTQHALNLTHTATVLLVGFPIVMAGAFFPDIDHHASIPHRYFKQLTSILTGLILATISGTIAPTVYTQILTHTTVIRTIPEQSVTALLVLTGFFTGWRLTTILITKFRPKHRGITHNRTTGLALGIALFFLISTTYPTLSTQHTLIVSTGWILGFGSHLYGDSMLI